MTRTTEETPAMKACRELVYGDGSGESLNRAIELARTALGLGFTSILSVEPDAFGFFYGFYTPPSGMQDHRRIDVQQIADGEWMFYVGGDPIGGAKTKDDAEKLAIKHLIEHPETV